MPLMLFDVHFMRLSGVFYLRFHGSGRILQYFKIWLFFFFLFFFFNAFGFILFCLFFGLGWLFILQMGFRKESRLKAEEFMCKGCNSSYNFHFFLAFFLFFFCISFFLLGCYGQNCLFDFFLFVAFFFFHWWRIAEYGRRCIWYKFNFGHLLLIKKQFINHSCDGGCVRHCQVKSLPWVLH